MFLCPRCDKPLSRIRRVGGLQWGCSRCDGRAITLPVLRRLMDVPALQQLWARTSVAAPSPASPCPACERPMVVVASDLPGEEFSLEACRGCQLVWFDADELERMPKPSVHPAPEAETPEALAAKQSLVVMEVNRAMAELRRRTAEEQPADLRLLPALLGLPLELHGAGLSSRPWTTWITAAIVTSVSIAAFGAKPMVEEFAFVPDQMWRIGGLTMLTAFFLHGGWLHLLGNLWFLVVFGDNVEDFLGRWRWLVLLASATVAGALLHALGEPRSDVPCLGASGGISGLIAFYALRFPRARLGTFLVARGAASWATFPAWGGFAFWIGMQGIFVLQQVSGFGNVSALAHVGGALAGVLAWWLTRGR